LVILVIDCVD